MRVRSIGTVLNGHSQNAHACDDRHSGGEVSSKRGHLCLLPHSSSSSRFTAGAFAFFLLSQSGERPEPQELLAVNAVLPVVTRMVIPGVVVVSRGVVTPVVGVDVGRLPSPEVGTPIGIAEPSLWPRFVDVDARNISFCRLSRHGQDCSRHYRENAEQGVA